MKPVSVLAEPRAAANAYAAVSRPRVAIFSDALPERNGAGAYYCDLAAQLSGDVDALELFQPVVKPRRLLRLSMPLPGDATQRLITPDVPRLWRQFRRLRPDVVVAVTPGPFGFLGLAFARQAGCGFVTGFHTHFEELTRLYGNRLSRGLANTYLVQASRVLCSSSDAVAVNNAALVDTVHTLGARHVEVVGTPLARCFVDQPPAPAPTALQRVLFAGRLAPEKNLPAVVEAARQLPDIDFTLAGDGPLRRELERAAQSLPNLRLTGWLERTGLLREMDAASLLLLPSHCETFGTVALEAMARGRPALVSASAGIHSWAVLREALIPLPAGASLADALHGVRRMAPARWRRLSQAARVAAEALNRDTALQWSALLAHNARRRA